MIEKFRVFLREANIEIKKVTWPDRKVTGASTLVVLVVVVLIGVYLGLVDGLLNKLYQLVLS